MQQDYLDAMEQMNYLKSEYQRQKTLLEEGLEELEEEFEEEREEADDARHEILAVLKQLQQEVADLKAAVAAQPGPRE